MNPPLTPFEDAQALIDEWVGRLSDNELQLLEEMWPAFQASTAPAASMVLAAVANCEVAAPIVVLPDVDGSSTRVVRTESAYFVLVGSRLIDLLDQCIYEMALATQAGSAQPDSYVRGYFLPSATAATVGELIQTYKRGGSHHRTTHDAGQLTGRFRAIWETCYRNCVILLVAHEVGHILVGDLEGLNDELSPMEREIAADCNAGQIFMAIEPVRQPSELRCAAFILFLLQSELSLGPHGSSVFDPTLQVPTHPLRRSSIMIGATVGLPQAGDVDVVTLNLCVSMLSAVGRPVNYSKAVVQELDDLSAGWSLSEHDVHLRRLYRIEGYKGLLGDGESLERLAIILGHAAIRSGIANYALKAWQTLLAGGFASSRDYLGILVLAARQSHLPDVDRLTGLVATIFPYLDLAERDAKLMLASGTPTSATPPLTRVL